MGLQFILTDSIRAEVEKVLALNDLTSSERDLISQSVKCGYLSTSSLKVLKKYLGREEDDNTEASSTTETQSKPKFSVRKLLADSKVSYSGVTDVKVSNFSYTIQGLFNNMLLVIKQ